MGVACGDFDGNGYPDLYCTNVPGGGGVDNPLLLNLGDGTFVEASVPFGVSNPYTSWGSVFADFTHNGWLDLYVNNMFENNTLFVNTGQPPCIELAVPYGVAANNGISYTTAVADIDNDGDLDLFVNNLGGQVELFINAASQSRNWAQFEIRGVGLNTFAIGAKVEILLGSGRWQSREIYAGGNGFLGQNDLRAHFGLDDAMVIDQVRVTWPNSDVVRHFYGIPANTFSVIDPALTADFDLDGTVGVVDLLGMLGVWGACRDCPADLDDDESVGILDLLMLLAEWTA